MGTTDTNGSQQVSVELSCVGPVGATGLNGRWPFGQPLRTMSVGITVETQRDETPVETPVETPKTARKQRWR